MIDDKDGSGAAGALDAISDKEGGLGRWTCAARAQGMAGGNDPADCDWPVCGCDPHADKVIAALQESGAIPDGGLTAAAHDVLAERRRQTTAEGWTAAHDDAHEYGDLALAAAAYAAKSSVRGQQGDVMVSRRGTHQRAGWFDLPRLLWPFEIEWWKPKTPRDDLVRAGALILAEIERLDRAPPPRSHVC